MIVCNDCNLPYGECRCDCSKDTLSCSAPEEKQAVYEIAELVEKGEIDKAVTALRVVWYDGYTEGSNE